MEGMGRITKQLNCNNQPIVYNQPISGGNTSFDTKMNQIGLVAFDAIIRNSPRMKNCYANLCTLVIPRLGLVVKRCPVVILEIFCLWGSWGKITSIKSF